ncbi:hypothetical protein ZIOFF_028983 [Zingiber officinale]|uniref:Uncharacterized protein n=1 Tax=Zingiber officinale TaxID=94328 RepID=A0A8J5GVW9_ZINOF|nr:hypothetical protein ZIOFF_028983 [Zingiber officinale]
MAALKSAYADIILNTTKESGTRILASERRARQLQQNLSVVKEESLAMLLRLKAIMEAKVLPLSLSASHCFNCVVLSSPNKADKGGLKSLDNRAKLILQWMPLKEKLESFFLLQLNGLEINFSGFRPWARLDFSGVTLQYLPFAKYLFPLLKYMLKHFADRVLVPQITESEKENLSQSRKIEELEVQLREANVMIHHLKSEIRRLNSELGNKRDTEAKFLDGNKPRSNISCMKYNIQEDIDKSDSYPHFPNEHEIIKNSSRCFTKDVMRHEPMRNFARSNHFGGNLDLASMTPNNKKPEFYQNGCIHRAQAFKQVHDQKSNPTTTCVNKKAERAFPQKFGTTIKRIRRRHRRRRKFIAWPTNSDTLHDMHHCGLLESSYSRVRESDIDEDMNRNGSMASPKCSAQVSGENHESIQNQKSNLNTSFGENNLGLLDGNGVMKRGTILKACNSTPENHIARSYTSSRITCQENGRKEPLIMSTSVVIDDDGKTGITTEQEMSEKSYCKVAEDLGTPVTKEIKKTTNAPLDDHKDEPCILTEPDAVVGGAKLLKYTFQRKRKRGSMDTKAEFKSMEEHVPKKKTNKGNEENMSPRNVVKDNEENVSTRMMENDDNVLVENQKSSMVVESSRDSRRMAQVARQVSEIFLSVSSLLLGNLQTGILSIDVLLKCFTTWICVLNHF